MRDSLSRPWPRLTACPRRRPDLSSTTAPASSETRSRLLSAPSLRPSRSSAPPSPQSRWPCSPLRALPCRPLVRKAAGALAAVSLPRPGALPFLCFSAKAVTCPDRLAAASCRDGHAARVQVDALAAETLARRRSDPAVGGQMRRARCFRKLVMADPAAGLLLAQPSRPSRVAVSSHDVFTCCCCCSTPRSGCLYRCLPITPVLQAAAP